MDTIIIGGVCFFSYLMGFTIVFVIMGKYYIREDNLLETHYSSIRPGQFHTEEIKNNIQNKEINRCFSPQEDECNENISDRTNEANNSQELGLCSRIPRKDTSYSEFIANLSEDESFDENMKENMRKENDAYKIIKRKKDKQ